MAHLIVPRFGRRTSLKINPRTLEAVLATADNERDMVRLKLEYVDTWHHAYNRYRDAVISRGLEFYGSRGPNGELEMFASREKRTRV